MSFLARHPREWREPIMTDHDRRDCCMPERPEGDDPEPHHLLPGHECSVCGWVDAHDNGPELHQAHQAHVLAGEQIHARRATHFANTGELLED